MDIKPDILAVDDAPASQKLLTELLHAEGYRVRSAISGEIALQAAAQQPPDLILLDVNMPGMSGFEVCRRLKLFASLRDVPVIFVTGEVDIAEKTAGFELGAVDYVTKPFQRAELLARVHTHLELSRLRRDLESMVEERTKELRHSEMDLRLNLLDSISLVCTLVESRDPRTAGHQRRVAELACAIARDAGMPETRIEGLNLASLVHDIGKFKLPPELLGQVDALDEGQLALLREHPRIGHELLKMIAFPWPIAQIVLQHHERLDGSGYPDGLTAADLLPESQALAVADTVDGMIRGQTGGARSNIDTVTQELIAQRGLRLHAEYVDACIRLLRERDFKFSDFGAVLAHA